MHDLKGTICFTMRGAIVAAIYILLELWCGLPGLCRVGPSFSWWIISFWGIVAIIAVVGLWMSTMAGDRVVGVLRPGAYITTFALGIPFFVIAFIMPSSTVLVLGALCVVNWRYWTTLDPIEKKKKRG